MILIALHRYELKKRKKCNQYLVDHEEFLCIYSFSKEVG